MKTRSKGTMPVCTSLAVLGLLLGSGCSRSTGRSVTLAGSTAFQPFAEKLAERYMATHAGARVNVQGGGSAVGIQSALSGAAEIGMADLLQLPDEAKALSATIVARDGIAIVVHPKNPVVALSAEQANRERQLRRRTRPRVAPSGGRGCRHRRCRTRRRRTGPRAEAERPAGTMGSR